MATELKIGWFQPLVIWLEDRADYEEHFAEIWEQLEHDYEEGLTSATRLWRLVWSYCYAWIEFQRRLLKYLEPD